jgi:hypothetical protein
MILNRGNEAVDTVAGAPMDALPRDLTEPTLHEVGPRTVGTDEMKMHVGMPSPT